MSHDQSPIARAAQSLKILHDSDTDMGRLLLRRRWSLALERDVYELTLDGNLMMSSAVVHSEQELARQALALAAGSSLRVLVGGLGFGFTCQAALAEPRVTHLTVVDRLQEVIDWHRAGMFPWSAELMADRRLHVEAGDFFARVAGEAEITYDAILIDIDDSPSMLWRADHASFYDAGGLEALARHVTPGGVLGLWCAAHPGEAFLNAAHAAFATSRLEAICFENPCHREAETNYLLLATTSSGGAA